MPMEFAACFQLRNSVPPANVALTPLKCLALGVFQDSVPVHLRTPLGPEYSGLFLDVLKPFFLSRQRCLGLGDYFVAQNVKFKVMGCEPAFGLISAQTLVQCYESLVETPIHRLQFAAISPGSLTEQVFMTTIRPYFRAQPRHIHKDQYLSFQGVNCLVVAAEPRNGVVTRQTEIFFEQTPLEQFGSVKLSPIGDSLPARNFRTTNIRKTGQLCVVINWHYPWHNRNLYSHCLALINKLKIGIRIIEILRNRRICTRVDFSFKVFQISCS